MASNDVNSLKRPLDETDSLFIDKDLEESKSKKILIEENIFEAEQSQSDDSLNDTQTFVSVCSWRKGERDEMQDRHVLLDKLTIDVNDIKRSAFFALFDGHAGKKAADYCASFFAKRISENCIKYASPTNDLATIEKSMKKIFYDSYKNIDDEFLKEAKKQRPALKDGTTATTLLLLNNVLYCANIGDSRAVVCRQKLDTKEKIAMQITIDHAPIMFNERMRIQKAGGTVKNGRVMGVLEVSRSIGDGQFKAYGVSCIPDVKKLTLSDDDLFIILACDGLWKKFTSEEAVNFVISQYTSLKLNAEFLAEVKNKKEYNIWKKISDNLCAKAVLKGCGDNVSVILIAFKQSIAKYL